MIHFKAYGSSSLGNFYTVDDGNTKLMIEAGIRFKEIQKAVKFRFSEFAGCLLTHCHGDHSKSIQEVVRAGVDVYSSEATLKQLGVSSHRAKFIEEKTPFVLGSWTILPFRIEHDVEDPLGFLLANRAGEKLVFATDTFYLRYTFSGLTHLAIECNFSQEILDRNLENGKIAASLCNRIMRSHMSLERLKEFLQANDLSNLREIHLLHLSDSNSDEALFKREIQAITGVPVYVEGR